MLLMRSSHQLPPTTTLTSDVSRRSLGLVGLLAIILLAALQSDFFSRPYYISHDTLSYVDLPGLSNGFSLSNFSSQQRTPGYSLFLAAISLGALPRSSALSYTICGNTVIGNEPPCDEIVAPTTGDVLVRIDPLVYVFSAQTAKIFQRSISAAKMLLIASYGALYLAIALWIDPILALIAGIALWLLSVPNGPSELENILTESLFPALLYFYAAAAMMTLQRRSWVWPVIGSILALFIFFVKPSLIYIDALQIALLLGTTIWRRTWVGGLAGCLPLLAGFVWFFGFSPTVYFSDADNLSKAIRVAMLSDEKTVECIADPDAKVLISAYIHSAYTAPTVPGNWPAIHNDIDRYFALAFSNAYRFELPQHPIYADPTIKPYVSATGVIPGPIMHKAIREAAACNRARDANMFVLVTQMAFGLTPPLTQFVLRRFFTNPWAFGVSFGITCAAIALAIWHGELAYAFVASGLPAIHILYVCIVAMKQGGESRYTFATEPMYVVGVVFAAAYLTHRLATVVPSLARCRNAPS